MRRLLHSLTPAGPSARRRRAAIRLRNGQAPSEPLDPGEILQDALHLPEQLPPLLQQPPLFRLEPANRLEADSQAFRLGGELAHPNVEGAALTGQPGVLGPQAPDQLDRTLDVLLEEGEPSLSVVVTH